MEKEKALANLLRLEVKLTKEVATTRGETKKTQKEYDKALTLVCSMLDINPEDVSKLVG